MTDFILEIVENSVGRRENAVFTFCLFHTMFLHFDLESKKVMGLFW